MLNQKYKVKNYKYTKTAKRYYTEIKKDSGFRKWYKNRLVKQRYLCFYCFADLHEKRANVEHVLPFSKGGNSKRSNLVIACWECNKKKGNTPIGSIEAFQLRQRFNQYLKNIDLETELYREIQERTEE